MCVYAYMRILCIDVTDIGWLAGLGWAGLGWAGLGWAGLAWYGLAWPGLAWLGRRHHYCQATRASYFRLLYVELAALFTYLFPYFLRAHLVSGVWAV